MTGPARQKVPWKVFWAAIGALVTAALGVIPLVAGAGPAVTIPVAVATGAAISVSVARVVHGEPMFARVRTSGKEQIVRMIWIAIAAHVLWVVAFAIRPDLWVTLVLTLAGMAGLVVLLARAQEYLLIQLQPPPAKTAGPPHDPRGGRPLDDVEKRVRDGLDQAGLSQVTIVGWEPMGDPAKPHGIEVEIQEPPKVAPAERR